MTGGVAMTGAARTGVAMIGIALTNTGTALVVVMMDKTVVVMMFQQCNGFVKAMIKFCEFYFLASMLYLDGSCLLLFRPRLRAVRAVQSWVESWIDGSHLGRCHLKGKYYDQRLIVATTPQQLVILFFGEYVLSCVVFYSKEELLVYEAEKVLGYEIDIRIFLDYQRINYDLVCGEASCQAGDKNIISNDVVRVMINDTEIHFTNYSLVKYRNS
ncbi:hypothetical protein BD770DRAFT_412189 [Pilaira anomala]|nr:hypothetical protein BD770DRAFT_412189 [Pilaira anomala]